MVLARLNLVSHQMGFVLVKVMLIPIVVKEILLLVYHLIQLDQIQGQSMVLTYLAMFKD